MAELVRQIIEEIYCCKYYGLLLLELLFNYDNSHRGWLLLLGLHCDERPLEIAFDGDDVDFLYRLHNILHRDRLHHTEYFNGYKITEELNLSSKYIKASII